MASRRHADSIAAAARVGSSPLSGSPRSSPRADAVAQHAVSARDNWGASPRALEHREAMMSQVASSPRSPTGSRGALASSGLASPHSRSAGPGSPRMSPTTEVEAHHHWAVYSAQHGLSQSLRQTVGVAASPTAFRSDHEPERRQPRYMDPYRPGGPAGVKSPGTPQASAKIAALQAKADLAANKLANMLPARPMDAGAPLGYSHYSTTAASGSTRPIRQTGVVTPKTATHFVGSPARRSTSTSFSSEMARSPGAAALLDLSSVHTPDIPACAASAPCSGCYSRCLCTGAHRTSGQVCGSVWRTRCPEKPTRSCSSSSVARAISRSVAGNQIA